MINRADLLAHIAPYRKYLKTKGYADTTVKSSGNLIREFFAHLEKEGIASVHAVERSDIEAFMQKLAGRENQNQPGKGLEPGSLAKYWQVLVNFDKYLQDTLQGQLCMPLSRNISLVRKQTGILTEAEIRALYGACEMSNPLGLRDRAVLALYYGCGLRRKEGLCLDVNDLHFAHSLIHVRAGKGRRERQVPMTRQVKNDLTRYLYQGRPYLVRKNRPTPALLLSERGCRPSGETIDLRLKKLQQISQMPSLQAKNISLHLLRHSIATHLLQRGMNLKRIARFLGHEALNSTQHYTHYSHGKLPGISAQ